MTDKCQPEKRFDLQLAALKEYINLKVQALQSEYSKSEQNYPTRQQLNEEMGKMLTKDEAALKFDAISWQMKTLAVGFVSLFLAVLIKYLTG